MISNKITSDLANHVQQAGGSYSQWYVGVTADPEQRLFSDHNVDKENGAWIYRQCESSTEARDIEKRLLALGFDGGTGGGDFTAYYVYAYKVTYHTKEAA
jgi:hypothetical protein